MAIDSKQILQEANAAVSRGDHEGFLAHCTEDTTWVFVGERTLRGKEAVRQYMKKNYQVPPTFDTQHLIADGDMLTAVGEIEMGGVRSAYADVWRLRDGKLAELQAFVVRLDQ